MTPYVIAIGGFLIILGAALLYFGMKTPEDKKVNIGFGTYYDRNGIYYRAIMFLIIGVVILAFGIFGNVP